MTKLLAAYLLFFTQLIILSCSATNYMVGDNSGWDISTDLNSWEDAKKFKVGDALVFQYSSSHSVNEVRKEDFDECNTNRSLATYSNGNSTVPLSAPGTRYFVCANKLHCLGGMKLSVEVEGDAGAYYPASAPRDAATGKDNGAALGQHPSSKNNIPKASYGVLNREKNFQNIGLMLLLAFFLPRDLYLN